MKSLIIVVTALSFVVAVSAERYIPNSPDPDKPGHCLHKDFNVSIKKDETITVPDKCIELSCQDDNVIRVVECFYPSRCEEVSGIASDKLFPDCCPKVKCGN